MILFAFGTRPEYLKINALVNEFKYRKLEYKVLFTGQHSNIAQFD